MIVSDRHGRAEPDEEAVEQRLTRGDGHRESHEGHGSPGEERADRDRDHECDGESEGRGHVATRERVRHRGGEGREDGGRGAATHARCPGLHDPIVLHTLSRMRGAPPPLVHTVPGSSHGSG